MFFKKKLQNSFKVGEFFTSLDQHETESRIQEMMRFIERDTDDKISVIYNEGLNDCNSGILLNRGLEEVDRQYAVKRVIVEKQTTSVVNLIKRKAKLRILTVKNDYVKSIVVDVHNRLISLQNNRKDYTAILQSLIMQSMCRLLETNVNLVLRPKDVPLIEPLFPSIELDYFTMTGLAPSIKVDPDVTLPDNHEGGVLVNSKNKSLFVDNTLGVRLQHLTAVRYPFVHVGLFK